MAVEIIATVVDRSGDTATTSVKVNAGTIAALTTFAATWATALNDLISGAIRSVVAYVILEGVGLLTDNAMQDASDVEHVAKFRFRTLTGTHVSLNIPAVDEDVIAAYSSDELDQADPQTAALIAAMISGISVTGGTIQPCDIGESSVLSVEFAREAFKNSGNRR
jgi:hypothetical protein